MAIHKFSTAILNDRPITLFGDGTTARDYTFIGDIVDGLVASIERAPDLGYEILNLGGGQTISLRALVEKIESIADKKACIEWQGDQPGDVKLTSADISRAREKLGYNPQTSIDEGLRATIEWLRAEQK
jgi:UDP-glucuronate 4-epimerase